MIAPPPLWLKPHDLLDAERAYLAELAERPAVNTRFGWRLRGKRRRLSDGVLARLVGMGLGRIEPIVVKPRSAFRTEWRTHRIVLTEHGRAFADELRASAGARP